MFILWTFISNGPQKVANGDLRLDMLVPLLSLQYVNARYYILYPIYVCLLGEKGSPCKPVRKNTFLINMLNEYYSTIIHSKMPFTK